MKTLHIRLFGRVSIREDGQPVSPLPAKSLELLCYLLLYRDSAHTREKLSEVLWPNGETALAQRYLRQALWKLKATLEPRRGSRGPVTEPLLILSPGWVRINPSAPLWLDVDAFEQVHAVLRDVRGQNLDDQQARDLEEAVHLYEGELMTTWYQDWCVYERERLQLAYLTMLEELMGYCEGRQHYTKGVAYGQSILRHDVARERTHRHLMGLYFRAGDRTAALRQYEYCAAAMGKEFGLSPSQPTVALYEQIRSDRLEERSSQAPAERPNFDGRENGLLVDLHRELDQLQASLTAMRRLLQQITGPTLPVSQASHSPFHTPLNGSSGPRPPAGSAQ